MTRLSFYKHSGNVRSDYVATGNKFNRAFPDRRGYLIMSLSRITTWTIMKPAVIRDKQHCVCSENYNFNFAIVKDNEILSDTFMCV